MVKTLIYASEGKTIAVLIRGDHDVNDEKLTQAVQGAHIELADVETIERVTGAKVGFAGPVGIAEKVDKILIDHAVAAMPIWITGANKTDYHTKNVIPGRDLSIEDAQIMDLRNAVEGDTHDGKKLLFKNGIEVGQVFKLGTKYSQKLGAKFLNPEGKEQVCLMGCYGIGINRIIASAIEAGNDKNGIIFPTSIAPFEVLITSVNQDDEQVASVAEDIYKQLLEKDIEVLLDDRILRGGVKFKDADLIGIPIRITVGKRSVAEGNVEIKLRSQQQSDSVSIDKAPERTAELVSQLYDELKK
jgi:prolyl-tRNA synthetase